MILIKAIPHMAGLLWGIVMLYEESDFNDSEEVVYNQLKVLK